MWHLSPHPRQEGVGFDNVVDEDVISIEPLDFVSKNYRWSDGEEL